MPIIKSDYKPSAPFRNGHLNTVYPYLFRKRAQVTYERKILDAFDGDKIYIDCVQNGNPNLAILVHGLEGSTRSQYMQYMSEYLSLNGWDVIGINHRTCSGTMNEQLTMYHSGFTDDLHKVISEYIHDHDKISLIGYSLGGNIVMKYMNDGIYPVGDKIAAAVAISTPVHLASSGARISHYENFLYEQNFLISLKKKMHIKAENFPKQISRKEIKSTKKLIDFDDKFTGPLHGFDGAQDYYEQCSSLQFLHSVHKPCLIINALDDPFLDEPSYPYDLASAKDLLFLMTPKYGGHVGFVTKSSRYYWHEKTALKFINEFI